MVICPRPRNTGTRVQTVHSICVGAVNRLARRVIWLGAKVYLTVERSPSVAINYLMR